MKLLRATQFASLLLFATVQILGSGYAQNLTEVPLAGTSAVAAPSHFEVSQLSRAFPRLHLWGSEELTYVGMFSPDAVFRSTSRLANVMGRVPGENILPASLSGPDLGHTDVPGWMLLHNERIRENSAPSVHATAVAQAASPLAKTRNGFLTCVYGRPSVLRAPRHIATDSQQRLIVSDPDGDGVHVVDPSGKTSFRILSGDTRRLQRPSGVAVDASDNIYVADAGRGLVVVFDRYGNFVRDVGSIHGEPDYARPEGIAIDRAAGRIYLIDSPRNLLFKLDLDGRVLKVFGKLRNGRGVGELHDPTEVVVSGGRVFVLDRTGGRIQIMDTEFHQMGSFATAGGPNSPIGRASGLGVDQQGFIYLTSTFGSTVRAFNPDGRPLATFGEPGPRAGEFEDPQGLWIDSANRLYVADSGNGRVQLFQLSTHR